MALASDTKDIVNSWNLLTKTQEWKKNKTWIALENLKGDTNE